MRIFAAFLLLISVSLTAQTPVAKDDPRSWPYDLRDNQRTMGNIGAWWSFLNRNEKGAFLAGYQFAMASTHSLNRSLCKVVKDQLKESSNEQAFQSEAGKILFVCGFANQYDGFEKITTEDLDSFYSDRVNGAVQLQFTMSYLRDKRSGKKTEGQLLDALKAEQKDAHDCKKYPSLCKLGLD